MNHPSHQRCTLNHWKLQQNVRIFLKVIDRQLKFFSIQVFLCRILGCRCTSWIHSTRQTEWIMYLIFSFSVNLHLENDIDYDRSELRGDFSHLFSSYYQKNKFKPCACHRSIFIKIIVIFTMFSCVATKKIKTLLTIYTNRTRSSCWNSSISF